MNYKGIPKLLWFVVCDVLAIVVIFWAIGPFAKWYLSKSPAIGVDLFNSITNVSYQLRHFSLQFNSFKDVWFGGYPLIYDYNQFATFFMLPFGLVLGAGLGVQIFAIFSLFAFIFCCYLLFFKLTENWGIAIFLALAVLLSLNIYGGLTWAGSMPYFFSQLFLPLGLFFALRYFEEANVKNLSLLAIVVAAAFLVHPLSTTAYLIPSSILFILAGGIYASHSLVRTLKQVAYFLIIFILGSFMITGRLISRLSTFAGGVTGGTIINSATAGQAASSSTISAVSKYYRDQIPLIWQHTNNLILWAAVCGFVLFLVAFPLSGHKKRLLLPLAFVLVSAGFILLPLLNLSGHLGILIHDPYRAFWQIPVAVSALAASLWGFFLSTFGTKLWVNRFLKTVHISLSLLITIVFGFLAYISVSKQAESITSTIDKNPTLVEFSSAYPEVLSINLQDQNRLNTLKKQLLPSFMSGDDKNRRLYSADQTISIWWNAFFEIPLARGYLDPPITNPQRGGLFWLDIAMTNDTLIKDFKVPKETAANNALFLIDWNGIYYFEGGRQGVKGPAPGPSSYLIDNNVFDKQEEVTTYGKLVKYNTVSGVPELNQNMIDKLNFFKVSDKLTSPVVAGTNAPVVVVFGMFSGYEDILRVLASQDINSRKLIPVWGGEYADKFSLGELKSFDAVILNQYKYHNSGKAFDTLSKYVRGGGKVFLDTGGDIKDADSSSLPELFPFKSSKRLGMGQHWDLSAEPDEILEGVKTSEFGPLVFNNDDWKLTLPTSDLRAGAKVLLRHDDKPVLVKMDFGQGKVVWSGINLAYHYSYYKRADEAKIFINVVKQFADISDHEPVDVKAKWVKPEKVLLKPEGTPRGVLFKEEGYNGWHAKLTSGGHGSLPIYLAGPTYPGFMYVPLRNVGGSGPIGLEFNFSGVLLYWFQVFVSVVSVIIVLEFTLFDGRIYGRRTLAHAQKALGKIFKWWEKEEEYN